MAGSDPMSGPVGIDVAYPDGRGKNKHADKNDKKKVAVTGIGDGEAGTTGTAPVLETVAARLLAFVETAVDPNSKIFGDDTRVCNGQNNHQTINYGDGEYIYGEAHINGTEPFRALSRRRYNGMFRHVEPRRPHRHVNEFTGMLGI